MRGESSLTQGVGLEMKTAMGQMGRNPAKDSLAMGNQCHLERLI
jgi:hypothetical protein